MVGDDGVIFMFYMVVGKDFDVFGVEQGFVVYGFGCVFFYEIFVCYIGIGLLVYMDEVCF